MDAREILKTTGRSLGSAAGWIGSQVATAFHAVDPDVRRHLAQLPLLGISYLSRPTEEIPAGEPDGFPPLILVHGLGGHRGNFLPMAGYFRLMGRKRTYRIHFGGLSNLEEMAQALVAYIRGVCHATGEPRVQIVAHSLGGIVTRLALAEHDIAGCVATVVTLGTPHRGTYAARFANTEITRQLRPDSPFMTRLLSLGLPQGVHFVTAWSENDVLILPAGSATLPGCQEIEMTPFTHYGYLLMPRAFGAVHAALGRPG